MPLQKSCKSCKYSKALESGSNGWCILRKIKVHSDIATYAFCHHWCQKEPSLPLLDQPNFKRDQQLDFGRELVSSRK